MLYANILINSAGIRGIICGRRQLLHIAQDHHTFVPSTAADTLLDKNIKQTINGIPWKITDTLMNFGYNCAKRYIWYM